MTRSKVEENTEWEVVTDRHGDIENDSTLDR